MICLTVYIAKDNWQLLLQIRSVKPSFLPRYLKFLSALESSNYLKLMRAFSKSDSNNNMLRLTWGNAGSYLGGFLPYSYLYFTSDY